MPSLSLYQADSGKVCKSQSTFTFTWLASSSRHSCKWGHISDSKEVPPNKNEDAWSRLYENGFINPDEMHRQKIQYVICFWKRSGSRDIMIVLRYFKIILQHIYRKAKRWEKEPMKNGCHDLLVHCLLGQNPLTYFTSELPILLVIVLI